MEDNLQVLYTSGTVFHAFLGEKLPDWRSAASLVKKIAYNFRLPYFTLSPTYSVCSEHGYIPGEHFKCPTCGKEAEVYSRITGYYRPIKNWNDGKVSEFNSRKTYTPYELKGKETPDDQIESTVNRVKCATTPCACSHKHHKPILITTSTCPNCRIAKVLLDEKGIDYDVLVADKDEKGKEIARKFNITQAPTLIVEENGEDNLLSNVSDIRSYLEEL